MVTMSTREASANPGGAIATHAEARVGPQRQTSRLSALQRRPGLSCNPVHSKVLFIEGLLMLLETTCLKSLELPYNAQSGFPAI
jgi:hypothetical protein